MIDKGNALMENLSDDTKKKRILTIKRISAKSIQWKKWATMAILCFCVFLFMYKIQDTMAKVKHHRRNMFEKVRRSIIVVKSNLIDKTTSSEIEELELSLKNQREALFKRDNAEIDVESKYLEYLNEFKKCKNSQENVVFLKTHKTGSSTITSILNRYADLNDLSILLPRKGLNRFRWPELFKSVSVERSYLKNRRKANILSNHARMNKNEMDKLMSPGTKYITILRNPIAQFESSFYYFKFEKLLRIKHQMNPMSTFLQKPMAYFKNLSRKGDPTMGLLRNGMLYDLGHATNYYMPVEVIDKAIQKVGEEFDLVLITEYFDESLVLLMRTFCWDFDDILYLKQNARTKKRRKISDDDVELIKQWNNADYKLYQTFNKTFWRIIEEEGPSFWKDLKEFKERNTIVKEQCGIVNMKANAHNLQVDINEFKIGKNINDFHMPFCKKLVRNEVNYITYFRKKYHLENKHYFRSTRRHPVAA